MIVSIPGQIPKRPLGYNLQSLRGLIPKAAKKYENPWVDEKMNLLVE
jgi:hypothetical protein